MQDIEFTIERGRLYVLQTRTGKRTGMAAVRIAVEMAEQKLISREEALLRVEPEALNHLLRPIFDAAAKEAATRRAAPRPRPAGRPGRRLRPAGLLRRGRRGLEGATARQVILARHETSPEDIRGMDASDGFLTAFGGMTSHAALVARQMGKVAIVGCEALSFDYQAQDHDGGDGRGGRAVLKEGDWISIDGIARRGARGAARHQPVRGGAGAGRQDR